MFRQSLVVLGVAVLASVAQAQPATPPADAPKAVSGLTREQVRAEFIRAREAGELLVHADEAPMREAMSARSTASREQVRKQLQDYVRSGQAERDRAAALTGG